MSFREGVREIFTPFVMLIKHKKGGNHYEKL